MHFICPGMRPSCSRSRSTCLASTESTSRLSAERITSTRSRRSLQPTRQSPCSSWPRSTGGDTYFNRFFPWYDGKGLEIEFCNVAWQKYESVTVSYSFHLWVKLSKELWNEWMWNIFTILLFFRIDKFFLISFPILFFIFNIIYWLAFIL